MATKKTDEDHHHKACARVLMDDFEVRKEMLEEVVELVKQVYDQERFPHCLIIQSVRGFIYPGKARILEAFLQNHGHKAPSHTKAKMLQADEY